MKTSVQKCASTKFTALLPLMQCLLICFGLQDPLEAAYKYPIGIPPAWIDPDVPQPARPDPWTAEISGYYYVDYGAGSDTGRVYGHPGAPRKTIPNPIKAGSRVEVSGFYNPTTGPLFISFNGDGGEWAANTSGGAWLVGSGAEARASFSGNVFFVGQYGCVEFIDNFGSHKGISINSMTSGKGRKANHFLLRNNELKGTNSAGDGCGFAILGNTDVGGAGEDIVIYKNEVHHFGVTDPDGKDYDYIAVFTSDNCHRIHVLDNKLHDMSGSAVQVTANASNVIRTTHVYAGRNECYNLWGTGMASKSARFLVYSENHVYNIKNVPGVSPSKGIAGQYAATDQWLLFNRIHNCAHGIMRVSGNSTGERLYAIGNVIYDIEPLDDGFTDSAYGEGGIAIWGASEAYLIANTLTNVPNGIVMPSAPLIYVENNIIGNINQANGEHFFAELSGGNKDIRICNNLFYQSSRPIALKITGVTFTNTDALNASSYGAGNRSGNPMFRDPATFDFSILGNSPAKDAGRAPTALESNVYNRFFNTFGMSIECDNNGSVRPAGAGWDIGAYEFPAAQTPPVPKPSGVKVTPIPK